MGYGEMTEEFRVGALQPPESGHSHENKANFNTDARKNAATSTRWRVISQAAGVRIQLPDVIKTRLISIPIPAKMQRLEVVTGHSEFLSHFSIPQANPTQPVTG